MTGLALLAFIGLGVWFYFVPTYVAYLRSNRNWLAILALNFFLGWTLLGWVGALVWSLTNQRRYA